MPLKLQIELVGESRKGRGLVICPATGSRTRCTYLERVLDGLRDVLSERAANMDIAFKRSLHE